MVIEWLKFQVPPEKWEAFIQQDEEVWTAGLQECPGFLGKEVWVNPEQQEIVLVIRWESQTQWDAVPESKIQQLDEAMGELKMPIVESRAYQMLKLMP